ncbi:MAG: hypothetical protein WEA61_05135 [Anaerolineales bacterium]
MVGKSKTANFLTQIYREIVIDEKHDKQFPMRFGLDICVTEKGVKGRNELAIQLIQEDKIAANWSDKSLLEKIDNTILELGVCKKNDDYPDFVTKASELREKLNQDFEEREALTIVEGLQVSKPLKIGRITFYPLEEKKNLINQPPYNILFSDVSPTRDCVASGKYRAEPRRSIELLHRETEYCLNILRYVGSLMWPNEQPRQVNIAGGPRQNAAYSLSLDGEGNHEALAESYFSVIPYQLDDELIQYANFYGLAELTKILDKSSRSEIEKALLTAVQWYGDATREIQPLFAFMKFYTPIDILLKGENEQAKKVIPKRLTRLFDPWNTDKKRTAQMKIDLQDVIRERNSVFHSGSPKIRNAENLRLVARWFSMGAINQTRQRISSEKLKTQKDLVIWLEKQAKQFK